MVSLKCSFGHNFLKFYFCSHFEVFYALSSDIISLSIASSYVKIWIWGEGGGGGKDMYSTFKPREIKITSHALQTT